MVVEVSGGAVHHQFEASPDEKRKENGEPSTATAFAEQGERDPLKRTPAMAA